MFATTKAAESSSFFFPFLASHLALSLGKSLDKVDRWQNRRWESLKGHKRELRKSQEKAML